MRDILRTLIVGLAFSGLVWAQSGSTQAQGGGIGSTSNNTQVQTPSGNTVGNTATGTSQPPQGTASQQPSTQQPTEAQQPAQTQQPTQSQQPAQAAPVQQPTQTQPAQSPEPQEPVLKTRPPQSQQSAEPAESQQQETGPVLQQRKPAATHIPHATTVPVGTEVHATLDTTLSSKTNHTGDAFTATLTEALKNQDGTVLIPAGAKINGTVQEAESGKLLPTVRGKGRLNLRFNDVQLANGTRVPISATLLGVHDSLGNKSGKATSDEEGQVTGKTSGTDVAKKVGIGAGIGTVAGLIFGSALKGLAIGAIAGGGYVLANAGKDVELPASTGLRLRLDQYLTVPNTGVNAQQ